MDVARQHHQPLPCRCPFGVPPSGGLYRELPHPCSARLRAGSHSPGPPGREASWSAPVLWRFGLCPDRSAAHGRAGGPGLGGKAPEHWRTPQASPSPGPPDHGPPRQGIAGLRIETPSGGTPNDRTAGCATTRFLSAREKRLAFRRLTADGRDRTFGASPTASRQNPQSRTASPARSWSPAGSRRLAPPGWSPLPG